MTGPLYEAKMPPLPNADESHVVPSHYWKIVAVGQGGPAGDRQGGGLHPQSGREERNADPFKGYTSVDEVERRSGLDFFHELPDQVENEIESTRFTTVGPSEHFSKSRK